MNYAEEKKGRMVKLSNELASVESSLNGKNLLNETKEKLKATQDKYMQMFDDLFDVNFIH